LVWEVFPVTIIFQSIYTDYAYFDKKNNWAEIFFLFGPL
jgi:hypothetical protein